MSKISLRDAQIGSLNRIEKFKMDHEAIAAVDNQMPDKDFHHPFEPYPIQRQLMSALYTCIEDGDIGIFESPTGTGKSLSIICGSLTWLRDHKRKRFEEGVHDDKAGSTEPSWVIEAARERRRQIALRNHSEFESRLSKIRAKEKKLKEASQKGEPRFKKQKTAAGRNQDDSDAENYLLDEYESADEATKITQTSAYSDTGLSADTQALLRKLGMAGDDKETEDEVVENLKIFYCSRTHSQLSQFANELKRVKLPAALKGGIGDANDRDGVAVEEVIKHLTLGSRKNLCINSKVSKLKSATAINERCLELQQPGNPVEQKCHYLPTKETEYIVNDFRDHAMASIRDIEDLGKLGKELGTCPYYATRSSTDPAEIVTLPYPLLLQSSAREALGISVKDHVVVIDEAHNLMDAITGIYSVFVSLDQLRLSKSQLVTYLHKFNNKLKGKNRVYVAQTVRLITSLIAFLEQKIDSAKDIEGFAEMRDMMSGNGVDQINVYKLVRYLNESKLARKVDGYVAHLELEKQQRQEQQQVHVRVKKSQTSSEKSTPTLLLVQEFLLSLMNPSHEGRFFYSKEGEGILLKYLLLDPSYHFKSLVTEARAVILCGGTMSPMSDYSRYLLPYINPSRIKTLSCGHVIPRSNLLVSPVTHGPSRAPLEFTFEKRNTPAIVNDLGQTLVGVVGVVPDGTVAFFPSYAYLDHCVMEWKKGNIWSSLNAHKSVFVEARRQTASTPTADSGTDSVTNNSKADGSDSILSAYTAAVRSTADTTHRGALLLAVTGGSLSEGINFSDELGRCIAVIGLPFPNPHSAEWKAKLVHVAAKYSADATKRGGGDVDGKQAARDFFENTAMRAVNQAVGRAIRHRGDYAAILLMDRRYTGRRVQEKLPGWIKESLVRDEVVDVGNVVGQVRAFFRQKQEAKGA